MRMRMIRASWLPPNKKAHLIEFCVAGFLLNAPGVGFAAGYIPSEIEATLLNIIRDDDIRAFSEGQENYASTVFNIKASSARGIGDMYAQNSDTANKQFVGMLVLLSGTVEAVHDSGQGSPTLIFANTGSAQVRAQSSKEAAAKLTRLRSGSNVALVCRGLGGAVSAAVFGDCELGDDFGQHTWDRLSTEFSNFYQGRPAKSVAIPTMAINIAERASLMSLDHPCADDLNRCRAAAMAVGNLRGAPDSPLRAVIDRFKAAGLDLSLFSHRPVNP